MVVEQNLLFWGKDTNCKCIKRMGSAKHLDLSQSS